jgi:hypothetical protein
MSDARELLDRYAAEDILIVIGRERQLIPDVETWQVRELAADRVFAALRAVLELCSGGYLSVAEIAGHLGQPVGVIRVLLAELSDLGYLMTRRPVPAAQLTDVHVLQEVLDGLQARFG